MCMTICNAIKRRVRQNVTAVSDANMTFLTVTFFTDKCCTDKLNVQTFLRGKTS